MYDNIPVSIITRTDEVPYLDLFLKFGKAKKFPRSVPKYIDPNFSFVIARIIYTLAKYYDIPVTWKVDTANKDNWTLSIPEMTKEFKEVYSNVNVDVIEVVTKYPEYGYGSIIPLLNYIKAMSIYYKWEDAE